MLLVIEILIVLTILTFLSYPLIWRRPREAGVGSAIASGERDKLQELLSKKETLYTTIKDLDYDHATDKLTEEDYQTFREKYRREATSLLEEIDLIEQGESVSLEDKIEEEIKALRQKQVETAEAVEKVEGLRCAQCGTEYSIGDKFCSTCGAILGLICPSCSTPHEERDKFCATCGHKIS